jgi:hypothetical protein
LIKRLESIEDTDTVEIEEHKSAKKTIKAAVKKVKQIASPFLKIVKSYAEVASGPTSSVSLPAIVPFCSPLLGATIEKKLFYYLQYHQPQLIILLHLLQFLSKEKNMLIISL